MASHLKFFWGAMGSAKTLRLLVTAHNLCSKNIQIMVLKPSVDTRDGDGVIKSRVGLERPCVMINPNVNLFKAIKAYKNVLATQFEELKWVMIDECQFLTEKQVDELSDAVDFLDVSVMCFGLRTDFQSKLFPGSKRLFELADDIEEIPSTCECGDKRASINARFDSNGRIITSGSQILIGGDDQYRPLCRKCWKEAIQATEHLN